MTAGTTSRLLKCERGVVALEFVILAPALLALVFGIVIYSLYFAASIGVQQAASEGARAAVAGLSKTERDTLAKTRADQVIENYRSVLGNGPKADVKLTSASGTYTVTVSYNVGATAMMKYNLIPLPAKIITASVTVTNGGY